MPRSLLARRQPDSIREFRAAAHQRFADGAAAASADRRTAAIYLWGYAAEMTLKAAYFQLIGFTGTQVITFGDLRAAVVRGMGLGIGWPPTGQLHNVRAWAELLVKVGAMSAATAYPQPAFAVEVTTRSRLLERLWSETLRYRKTVAYLHEVTQVRESSAWLLAQTSSL